MKKNLIMIISIFIFITFSIAYGGNTRTVYFIDGYTGEIKLLTSSWFKRNTIQMKDAWFDDYETNVVSGLIFIEDNREYAVFPYTYHNLESSRFTEFYPDHVDQEYELVWIKKTNQEHLSFEVKNVQSLWISVGVHQSIPGTDIKYGRGIYTMPVFNDRGEVISELSFAENDYISLGEGWNDFTQRYVLQQFIFSEITIVNQHVETYFMPILFLGGSNLAEVGNSEHYYYSYNGYDLIFEATLLRLVEPYCSYDCIH